MFGLITNLTEVDNNETTNANLENPTNFIVAPDNLNTYNVDTNTKNIMNESVSFKKKEIINFGFDVSKLKLLKIANDKLKITQTMLNKRRKIIFVYCHPKVGSTALVSSIRLFASDKYFVIHVHNEIMLRVLYGIDGVTVNEIIYYNSIIGNDIYVIDIFRNPIERKISLFFEDIASFHFNNTNQNILKYKLSRIFERFNNIYSYIANGDNFLDVYNLHCPEEFNYQSKYLFVESNGIKYIKLRLQDSSEWEQILSKLLNSNIKIIKDYETDKKEIGELYNNFKKEYRLPLNYYHELEKCNYLKYFLSKKEREEYLNYWHNKTCDNFVGYTQSEYALYEDISNKNSSNIVIRSHYVDGGCICKECASNRLLLVKSLLEGGRVKSGVVHTSGSVLSRSVKDKILKRVIENLKEKNSKPSKLVNSSVFAGIRGI